MVRSQVRILRQHCWVDPVGPVGPVGLLIYSRSLQGEEGVEEQELLDSEMALLEANILISYWWLWLLWLLRCMLHMLPAFSPHRPMGDMFHVIKPVFYCPVLEIRHFPRAQTQQRKHGDIWRRCAPKFQLTPTKSCPQFLLRDFIRLHQVWSIYCAARA